ncbi:hypothetical protein [Streptomyces sp. NPDC094032]|uniref:hypothetical protein n=1 Tax=Streptomyces sp. NPDC094032 TaxID=3155308 RepID=UPI00332E19A2
MTDPRPWELGTGPLPKRSRWTLSCQYYLQWLYIPLGLAVAFVGSVFSLSGGFGGSAPQGAGAKGLPKDPYGGDSLFLNRRQYLLELRGSTEEWTGRADIGLRRAITRQPQGPVTLGAEIYRGIGLGGLEALAEPLGWRVDRSRTRWEPGHVALLVPRAPAVTPESLFPLT